MVVLTSHQFRRAWAMKSGPLSDRMNADRQAETAVLVDHVQELEPAAVGRGIELEIHGPHLVGMVSPVTSH